MRIKLASLTAALGILFALSAAFASNQPQEASSKSQTAPTTTQAPASKTASSAMPSAPDIAAAKASGKVWVNLDTGIYHKGGRWYGKTKDGKFLTEDDAKKAGYKAAKRD